MNILAESLEQIEADRAARQAKRAKVSKSDRSKRFRSSMAWRRMRLRVLREENRTCRCCGRSKQRDNVTIDVDHIRPISKFWELRLERSNLRSVCRDCHAPKGATVEDEWY